MNSQFTAGIESFFEAIKIFINNKTIRNLSLIPMLMSVVLFTVGLISGVMFLDQAMDWIIHRNVSDMNIALKTFLYLISFILLVLGLYVIILMVVSILAIPVCTIITQKTLESKGVVAPNKTYKQALFSALKMTKISFQKFIIYIIVAAMIFTISFFPLVAPIGLYLSFMLITFDAIDYSLEIEEMTLGQRINYCRKHWIPLSGLAFCLMGLASIPVVHILFLPIAVISASLLFTKLRGIS